MIISNVGLICANYVAATVGRAHVNTDCVKLRGAWRGTPVRMRYKNFMLGKLSLS